MSTPRTRKQQRSSQPLNQPAMNQPAVKSPKIPVIVTIVLAIIICTASSVVNKSYPNTVPKGTVPITIVVMIVVIAAIIIRFIKNQYMMLKNTYQTIERYAQQNAYMLNQTDTEYCEYPMQDGYYPVQGQGLYDYSYTQTPPNPTQSSRKRKSKSLAIVIVLLIVVLPLNYSLSINVNRMYLMHIVYEKTMCTATDVQVLDIQETRTDDDGDEYTVTVTKYDTNFMYTYNGKSYYSEKEFNSFRSKGCVFDIYVNPNIPSDYLTDDDVSYTTLYLTIIIDVVFIIFLLRAIAVQRRNR